MCNNSRKQTIAKKMEADLDEMIENPNEGVTRLIKDCVQWEDNIKRKNSCEYIEVIYGNIANPSY